jgi:hypothetical protein
MVAVWLRKKIKAHPRVREATLTMFIRFKSLRDAIMSFKMKWNSFESAFKCTKTCPKTRVSSQRKIMHPLKKSK